MPKKERITLTKGDGTSSELEPEDCQGVIAIERRPEQKIAWIGLKVEQGTSRSTSTRPRCAP